MSKKNVYIVYFDHEYYSDEQLVDSFSYEFLNVFGSEEAAWGFVESHVLGDYYHFNKEFGVEVAKDHCYCDISVRDRFLDICRCTPGTSVVESYFVETKEVEFKDD